MVCGRGCGDGHPPRGTPGSPFSGGSGVALPLDPRGQAVPVQGGAGRGGPGMWVEGVVPPSFGRGPLAGALGVASTPLGSPVILQFGFFPMKFRLIYQPMGLGAAPGAVASFPIALLFAVVMKDAATCSSSSGDEGLAVLRPSRHQKFRSGMVSAAVPSPNSHRGTTKSSRGTYWGCGLGGGEGALRWLK